MEHHQAWDGLLTSLGQSIINPLTEHHQPPNGASPSPGWSITKPGIEHYQPPNGTLPTPERRITKPRNENHEDQDGASPSLGQSIIKSWTFLGNLFNQFVSIRNKNTEIIVCLLNVCDVSQCSTCGPPTLGPPPPGHWGGRQVAGVLRGSPWHWARLSQQSKHKECIIELPIYPMFGKYG